MNKIMLLVCIVAGSCFAGPDAVSAPDVYPMAIINFEERGVGIKGYGEKITDLMFAALADKPNIILVDRGDLQKVFDEHALNLSGMISPEQSLRIGQLTGAKILLAGSVIDTDSSLILVAKVIGTETSRTLGESVKGQARDDLALLVESLADKVAVLISTKAGELVAKTEPVADRIAGLNATLGSAQRPMLTVDLQERHVGRATIDPAAQTEITYFCKETGFEVLDAKQMGPGKAGILIKGAGISEFAARQGNLISVKARLELDAIELETGRIIAVDRQTVVVTDLTEELAGKAALQEAAARIAERLLPKLIRAPGD